MLVLGHDSFQVPLARQPKEVQAVSLDVICIQKDRRLLGHDGDLRRWLTELATAIGRPGSEIFPKQDSLDVSTGELGNFINLPYYAADMTVRWALNSGCEVMSFEEFLDTAEAARRPASYFEQPLQIPPMTTPPAEDKPKETGTSHHGSPKQIWTPEVGSRHNYIIQRIAALFARSARDLTNGSLVSCIRGMMDEKLAVPYTAREKRDEAERRNGFYDFGKELLRRALESKPPADGRGRSGRTQKRWSPR
jgi:hypothetical protein